ncbi:hypothetical protein C4565_00380 [Candidatus Parcubacteria bacterium]|nr:MAG: hypothetical protein C4565_00380 [Candidatus Parcubacteria bacterium]
MYGPVRCKNCDKHLEIKYDEFDGKTLWVNLDITRFYKKCSECHHMNEWKVTVNFCSPQCLKLWVEKNLDDFVKNSLFPYGVKDEKAQDGQKDC